MDFPSILLTEEERDSKEFWLTEDPPKEDLEVEVLIVGPLIMDVKGCKKRFYFILLHQTLIYKNVYLPKFLTCAYLLWKFKKK